jgi:hypothetical protein
MAAKKESQKVIFPHFPFSPFYIPSGLSSKNSIHHLLSGLSAASPAQKPYTKPSPGFSLPSRSPSAAETLFSTQTTTNPAKCNSQLHPTFLIHHS